MMFYLVNILFLNVVLIVQSSVVVVIGMSCYHPMIGFLRSDGTYEISGSRDPEVFRSMKHSEPGIVMIPCGRCLGCRLEYSRCWADRMMLELEVAKKGIFLTLTYDDDHVPYSFDEDTGEFGWMTLQKKDYQDFLKRLRERKEFKDKKIRYFLSGEYGSTTHRPHYHCIIFGIGLDDIPDLCVHGKNPLGQLYYSSDLLAEIWSCGFCLLSGVSWETCAYVARYVMKKVGLNNGFDVDAIGVLPEFSVMSRRPGIGRPYLDAHPDCLDYKTINISTETGGKKISIPKYFIDQLDKDDPDRYSDIVKARMEYAEDRSLSQLRLTDLFELEYLAVKEHNRHNSVKVLERSL